MWGASALAKEVGRGLGELRDRLHELELAHQELEELVDGMTKAEEIAAAVTVAIRNERRAFINWPRKTVGAVLAVLIAAPALHDLVSWIG